MTELPLEASTVLVAAPGIYARAFGDELVLLQFATGEYFGLDAVGATVWSEIERGAALGAISAKIAGIYAVEEIRAFRDIQVLVREMCDQSLLVRR